MADDWHPTLNGGKPVYAQIVASLLDDIRAGRLKPGEGLPSQRELAAKLGIATATVTKAYKEVTRLKLIEGKTRAGTRIAQSHTNPAGWTGTHRDARGHFDLASNCPPTDRYLLELSKVLRQIAERPPNLLLQEYWPIEGQARHRGAGAAWLGELGVVRAVEEVVLVDGANLGLVAVLSSQGKPGSLILCERCTYSPLRALARQLQMEVQSVEADEEGIIPAALARASDRRRPCILFVTPNVNNPTAATMGINRRSEIARVVEEQNLVVIEDDVYRTFETTATPTLASLVPQSVFYLYSFSKSVSPGLRMGFVACPSKLAAGQVASAVGLTTRMVTPLMAEIAATWIENGVIDSIVQIQRDEFAHRNQLVRTVLHDQKFSTRQNAPHLWLQLPSGWAAMAFELACAREGVAVVAADCFAVGPDVPNAVRITIGGPRRREDLQRSIELVRSLAQSTPLPAMAV